MQDFSFQGKVYLGARQSNGKAGKLRWVGDAPRCEISLSTQSETRKESYSGNRSTSARLSLGNEATISLTLNWAEAENLVLGLYGTSTTVAAGSVTNELLPTVVAGDTVLLDHGNVSTLVITDSTGTPATVPAGNYVLDAAGGTVKFTNVGSFTQPFKAAYAHTGSVDVSMFTSTPPERYLFLDGINTLDGSRVRLRLYRVKFDPASSIPAINESFGELPLEGSVLFDSLSAADPLLGGFGKLELVNAVA